MLRQGTLSLFYVPPDLEPGEAAQAVALQLPEEFEWTRSEFRAVAMEALRTAAFDAVSKLKRVRRFWLALERAAKAGCPMKVGSDLVGREALSVTFFPEAVDSPEWYGVDVSWSILTSTLAGLPDVAPMIEAGVAARHKWLLGRSS